MSHRKQPPQTVPDTDQPSVAERIWDRPIRFQTVENAIAAYQRLALLWMLAKVDGNVPVSDALERWNDEVWDSLPEYARAEVQRWITEFTTV